MAGYEYRGTEARRRRAEEFGRRRAAAETAWKLKAETEKKRPAKARPPEPKPAPAEPKEQTVKTPPTPAVRKPAPVADEFAVVEEEPPSRRGASGGVVKTAALEALEVLRARPNVWFRVAKRDSKPKASSYAATLHRHSDTLETRTDVDDDGRGILYARINPNRPPKNKTVKS